MDGLSAAVLAAAPSAAGVVDNTKPRLDTDGNIVDAHGGQLSYFCDDPTRVDPSCAGKYWLIGTAYNTGYAHPGTDAPTNGSCVPKPGKQCDSSYFHCGYRDHDYTAYSAPSPAGPWTLEASSLMVARGSRPHCVYWRPKILFNDRDKRYVLWYECADPNGQNSTEKTVFGVAATAASTPARPASPAGPYAVVSHNVSSLLYGNGVGDSSLFKDRDGTAYIIYTTVDKRARKFFPMSIERLTPSYTASTGNSSGKVFGAGHESPALIYDSVTDEYVASVSQLCCFCPAGGGLTVYRSSISPLEGWKQAEQINSCGGGGGGEPVPKVSKGHCVGAQQAYIAQLPIGRGGRSELIWMGDRWQSAWDGTKGHDFQHWEPVVREANGSFAPLRNLSHWSVKLLDEAKV